MKVLLLLVVALAAVAHARYYSGEAASQSSESSEQAASPQGRYRPAQNRAAADDDDSSDSSDSQERSSTKMPCPQACPLIYQPVCVRDSQGVYRKFSNQCMLDKCCCETDLEYQVVPLKKCRGADVPECPRPWTPYHRSQPDDEEFDAADSAATI